MRKHKFEKFVSSILGTHIHPDNTEVLETKKDMEKNVEKILTLIGGESDLDYSIDSSNKSEIASLIKGFHKGYQNLHEHYDQLIEKLKQKAHYRGDNGNHSFSYNPSSSESSDSESDSEHEKFDKLKDLTAQLEERKSVIDSLENRLRTLEEHVGILQGEKEVLTQKLEASLMENKDINERFKIVSKQNETLKSENTAVFSSLEQAHKLVTECTIEKDQMKEEMLMLESEIKVLRHKVEEGAQRMDSITHQLNDRIKEKDASASENESLRRMLEDANRKEAEMMQSVKALEEQNRGLQSEILVLTAKMEEAGSTINNLRSHSELLEDEKLKLLNCNDDLREQLRAKESELDVLASMLEKVHLEEENKMQRLSMEIQKLEDENAKLIVNYSDMKLEIEARDKHVSELEQNLEVISGQNQSLTKENSSLTSKLQQVEEEIDGLRTEKEGLMSDKCTMDIRITDLDVELNKVKHQLNSLDQEYKSATEESDRLNSEISMRRSELEQAYTRLGELVKELEELKGENLVLQQDKSTMQDEIDRLGDVNSQLQIKVNDLTLNLEAANSELIGLTKITAAVQEEKNSLAFELQMAGDLAMKLESELECMRQETEDEIKAMNDQMKELRKEIDLLLAEKFTVEGQVRMIRGECTKTLNLMDNLLHKITSRIVCQETRLVDLGISYSDLLKSCEHFKCKFRECCSEIENLKYSCKQQDKERRKLEESRKELMEKLLITEEEKAAADRENAKLNDEVQALEVQVRLIAQKLKVTETGSKEKEETQKRLVETLQGKIQELEEQKRKLFEKLVILEDQLMHMKENAKVGISALGNQVSELKSLSDQRSSHFIDRVSECSKELKTLKRKLEDHLHQKEALKEERNELVDKLEAKEEQVLGLQVQAITLGDKLAEKEKDVESLMRTLLESEKMVEELEGRVKGKEEEIADKNEEKREAIRQLCLLIEYHRENCHLLLHYLSTTLKRGGRR